MSGARRSAQVIVERIPRLPQPVRNCIQNRVVFLKSVCYKVASSEFLLELIKRN